MRRFAAVTLALVLPVMLLAEAEEAKDGVDALLETIDLSEWDAWFRTVGIEGIALPSEFLRALARANEPDAPGLTFETLCGLLLPSLKSAARGMMLFLGLAILCAALKGAAESSTVGETSETAFRVTAAGSVLVAAFAGIRTSLHAFTVIDGTAELILPPLIGFLTLNGMTNTAALLPVSHALLSETVLKLMRVWAAPLAVLGGVLLTIDAGGTGRLAAFGKLLQRAAKWTVGTACALFLTVTAVRSAAAGSADGLLMKTTKLAAGSIPAVGALLSESVDTAYQCLRFVRHILGLTGCTLILAVALKPILSILTVRYALRASALLAEPISGKGYADLLRGVGDTMHILMLAELAATASALFVIAPVFGAAGGS